MEITEVRIKLMEEPGERLQAFCSITFDNCFVVRDMKIIEGTSGPFVAMPSRKLTAHCPSCGMKNHLRAPHCNQCGKSLPQDRLPTNTDGRAKLYADIAHPINSSCREMIQDHVVKEYYEEVERAKQPNYVSRYDDFDVEYHNQKAAVSESTATKEKQKAGRIDPAHDAAATHEQPAPRRENADARNTSAEGFGEGVF